MKSAAVINTFVTGSSISVGYVTTNKTVYIN